MTAIAAASTASATASASLPTSRSGNATTTPTTIGHQRSPEARGGGTAARPDHATSPRASAPPRDVRAAARPTSASRATAVGSAAPMSGARVRPMPQLRAEDESQQRRQRDEPAGQRSATPTAARGRWRGNRTAASAPARQRQRQRRRGRRPPRMQNGTRCREPRSPIDAQVDVRARAPRGSRPRWPAPRARPAATASCARRRRRPR